jgi:hypothetical protein
VKPILQALLVADHIYTDSLTGKRVICGVFNNLMNIKSDALEGDPKTKHPLIQNVVPGADAGSPSVYISLTDVRGEQHFDLRYVDLREDEVLFQFGFELKCDDPLKTLELVFPSPRLPRHKLGVFAFELLWDNEPLGSHRIAVSQLNQRPPDGDS